MNSRISYVIGAAVGGSLGWFVGSVVADYLDEKELRDQAPVLEDEEGAEDDDEEESSIGADVMSKKKRTVKKKEKTNYSAYFKSIDRPDLAALAKKYNEGEVEGEPSNPEVTLIDVPEEEPKVVDKNAITIISAEDFNNNQDEFEVTELSYYADEIVVGEDDNVIPDPEDIIGDDALVSFGMLSGDPDIVYVRNPKIRAIYEIVRMTQKYAIDANADEIIPRKGLKPGIDFDEVEDEENDKEVAS